MTFVGNPTIATIVLPVGPVEIVVEVHNMSCDEAPSEGEFPLDKYVGKKVTVTGKVVRVKC